MGIEDNSEKGGRYTSYTRSGHDMYTTVLEILSQLCRAIQGDIPTRSRKSAVTRVFVHKPRQAIATVTYGLLCLAQQDLQHNLSLLSLDSCNAHPYTIQ